LGQQIVSGTKITDENGNPILTGIITGCVLDDTEKLEGIYGYNNNRNTFGINIEGKAEFYDNNNNHIILNDDSDEENKILLKLENPKGKAIITILKDGTIHLTDTNFLLFGNRSFEEYYEELTNKIDDEIKAREALAKKMSEYHPEENTPEDESN
jgi:hypothetical protein